jgi:hypothetical protein
VVVSLSVLSSLTMSFNGINVNHIRGGARTYPATSLVG